MVINSTAPPKPRKKKSHLLRNVLIVVFAIFFSVGAVVATPPIFFINVTLSGTASTNVSGSSVSNVTFVDENGVPYAAPAGPTGVYSISLMNGHTYSVYVVYSLAGGSGGNCSAGSLNLYTFGFSQTYDVAC